MNEELLFLFSKFMWKQILSYFCGTDCIFKPGAVLCAVLNPVLERVPELWEILVVVVQLK